MTHPKKCRNDKWLNMGNELDNLLLEIIEKSKLVSDFKSDNYFISDRNMIMSI